MANLVFLVIVVLGGVLSATWHPKVGGEETTPAFVMFLALLIGATARAIVSRFHRDE